MADPMAQVAMLRESLESVLLHEYDADQIASVAYHATEADAAAWLDRQRKLAAADALEGRAADFTAIATLPRRCNSWLSREDIAKGIFLAAANNCRSCAAELRKQAEASR